MKPAKTAKNWIWQMIKPNLFSLVLLSITSGLGAGGSVVFALLSRSVIDMALGEKEGNFWIPGVGILVLLVAEMLVYCLNNYLKARTSSKIEIRIKERLFRSLFCKQWNDLSSFHSGELLNRMNADGGTVVSGITTLIPHVVSIFTKVIACLIVLVRMDWRFTIALLAFGVLLLVLSRFYGKKTKELHKDCQSKNGKAKSFEQESFANGMLIQSFDGSEKIGERLRSLFRVYYKAYMRRANWTNLSHSATYLVFSGGYYLGLLWGVVQLTNPASGMTYGAFTAFLQIVSQIRTPFMNMSGILPQYFNMLASAERILELENLPDEPRLAEPYSASDLYRRMQSLEASNVHFAYDEDKPVLTGADLTVKKGEFVALAGYSGIGKSTLFKLMLGFYSLKGGSLTANLDGESLPLGADTRCLFAYVPQKSMLLSGTIRENVAFCCEETSEEAIWAAAEVADIAEAIRQMPDGLDTMLGEGGAGLSEGQLQRLAIARAVLSGAPILLLDECTASLDEATEERVLRNLRNLQNRTCLCISHRPAALEICDRIIRVEDGKIVVE